MADHDLRREPGWTVAGIVEHLGNAERHWFQEVVAGVYAEFPWDEGRPAHDPEMAFTCDRPSDDVLGYYQEQCDRADEIVAEVSLSDVPPEFLDGATGLGLR
jgi:Protein of unknown function (DUF664)